MKYTIEQVREYLKQWVTTPKEWEQNLTINYAIENIDDTKDGIAAMVQRDSGVITP